METEGNKVLAEFMGYDKDKWWHLERHEFDPCNNWNDLHPIWIKFRELLFTGKNEMEHSKVKHDLFHKFYRANSPSDFFPHLVEAVKWYNQTKTK